MPLSKEEVAVYKKQYREQNKEKIAEYRKKYYEENKEKLAEQNKKYYYENKEKLAEWQKEYREDNKEKRKEYNQTETGKKKNRISNWKRKGVISDDFDALYKYFINCKNCEECNIELTEDRYNTATTRCLDHSHETGLFRNVLCQSCNVKRR